MQINSNQTDLPNRDMIPQRSHVINAIPTLPEPSVTPVGEINIPEPVKTNHKYQTLSLKHSIVFIIKKL